MNFFQLRLSINRTSLLRLNASQAVSPHQGLLTLPGIISIYDMGWRLAPRAICPATVQENLISDQLRKFWDLEVSGLIDSKNESDVSEKSNNEKLRIKC
ncbi:hypothetical protein TNCV_2528431 [Trichonephila clavipes]|nr:hypothetical protein TNCV_2528431 [Trichonephila clavipes]